MMKFKPVFVSREQFENAQIENIPSFINDGTHGTFKFMKVPITPTEYTPNILNFTNSRDSLLLLADSENNVIDVAKVESNSVKATVRIDDNLFQTLSELAGELNASFNMSIRNIGNAVINMGKIYLLPTKNFSHRITIHFSVDEYCLIQEIVHKLKRNGLKWVTFSLVVRSILYEALVVVLDLTRPECQKILQLVA